MVDEPEDEKPAPADTPTPFTTAGQLAGVVRETLWSNPTSPLRVAGVVREALISGFGLSGTIGARSSAQGFANTSLATVTLTGRIQATSQLTTSSVFVIALAGRIKATASLNTAYVAPQNLAGRIGGQSSLNMGLSIRLYGMIGTQSAAQSRNLSKTLALSGGRITASSTVRMLPLPTPLSIAGRVTAQSKARLTDPYHVDGLSIAGRIGATSAARLWFGGRFSEFVTLNLG